MKAVISDYCKKNNQYVRLDEVSRPSLGQKEVLIKVVTASLNFADVSAIKGDYHALREEVFIPGFDCAGVVMDVGENVEGFSQGDRVAGFPNGGALAEYVSVNSHLTYRLPENVSFDSAASILSIGVTAYELAHKAAGVKESERVLVHAAAGGVGLTLLQLLKRKQAKIFGTVGNEQKKRLIEQYGATKAILYRSEDFETEIVHSTGGTGVDIVFDSVGGQVFEKSLKCLAPYGKLITYGHASGQPGRLLSTDLHSTSRSIVGYSSGQRQHECPSSLRASAEKVLDLLSTEDLSTKISRKLSMVEVNTGFQLMADRHNIGKIIITP
ncbi:zinc-binding dehydrogenase [Thalassobacillus sp. CUG 92003]|uniref:quinone oxidoreductase family protein n=1 Tax=Thalassobacillus sp. CUG 92003 TaxID=2736641 RepID=UPI0015E6E68D|nr:zinc-binding dehydrogenase [Thalassobacillus sp. CUG 92003]